MTTLPTTTPIRLPRPAGATPLALPSPMGGPVPGASPLTGADAWRVLRTNFWWIALVTAICAGLGYGLNWYLLRKHSSYTAVGYTQVNPPVSLDIFRYTPTGTDVSSLGIDQRTQAALLKQEALFVQVLQNPNSEIRKTTWWQSFNGNVLKAKANLLGKFGV